MKTYKVKARWANVHDGIVAVSAAVAARNAANLNALGDGTFAVVQPIQIPRDEVFRLDRELTLTNVILMPDPPMLPTIAPPVPPPFDEIHVNAAPADDVDPDPDPDPDTDGEWPPAESDTGADDGVPASGARRRGRPRKPS
jgi:hypothetical protein